MTDETEKKDSPLPRLFMPLRGERVFQFATMDIETSEWVNVVRVGFYDGKEFKSFDTLVEAMKYFMQSKYKNWRCFLHNMAGFDGQFIIEELTQYFTDYKFEILSNNGASMIRVFPKSARKKYHPYSWIFLDSMRLLPKSLKDLTYSFDVEHKKLDDIDFKNIKADPAKLERYLMHDCMGLYEVLKKFEGWFKKYKVPLMPTTASQAMAVYRRMMPYPIPTLAPEVEKFVRKAYYGGRTEIFKMKCIKKLYLFDVNSLYPACMYKYPMPVGSPKRVEHFVEGAVGFYHCRVYVPEMYLPPLPYNMNGKLIFPCGRFEGYYSSIELEMAKSLGCKVTVKEGYVFPSDFIFEKYVDTFYEMKKNGDEVTRAIAKLMLLGLYGKFGQNREKMIIVKPDPNKLRGLIPFMPEVGLYHKKTVSKAVFIIPSISAWISACARVELYKWMQKVGSENIYYSDTDSVFSTKALPVSDLLGEMKLEKEIDEAIFLLPKMYITRSGKDVKIKAKGFERDFANKLTIDSFEKALHGDTKDFHQVISRFGKFKEVWRREGKFVSMLTKKKSVKTVYSKRHIGKDFNTFPLTINESPLLDCYDGRTKASRDKSLESLKFK